MRTRTKICGLRGVDDALVAVRAGADAIGLIFYPPSPRAVTLAEACAIRQSLPPFVTSVALLVNPARELVESVCDRLKPGLLQFHGDESAEFCASFAWPYLKAIRVGEGMLPADLLKLQDEFSSATALLLDTQTAGQYGGSGRSFDWQMIPAEMRTRIVLSGGLDPGNVGLAVKSIRPWAVDVSSGVESQKGFKDHAKIVSFIEAVRLADQDAIV
jgi:phosphoribosylanthranilate isomerase